MAEKLIWADLFDFTNEADVQKAIKSLNELLKSYTAFIKATQTGANQIKTNQKALVTSIKEVEKAAKSLNETNKDDQKTIEKQNAEVKALSASYEAQKKQISDLNRQIKALTKERSAVAKKTKDVNNINKEAIKLEAQLGKLTGVSAKETAALKLQIQEKRKALAAEAKVAAGRVTLYQKESKLLNDLRNKYKNVALAQGQNSKAARNLLAQIKPLDSKLKQLDITVGQGQRSIGLYGQSILNVGRQIAGAAGFTGIIFGLISVIRSSVKTIIEFDKEMTNLAAIVGETRDELSDVEREIRRVGKTSINSALEVAKTATALFTLGKTKEEVIDLLDPVNSLAIALQAPADAAGELLIQTLNAFGKSSDSAQEFADIIAKIRTSTALDFERIKDSLAFIAPTAKALGITFAETGALLGVLVDNGIKASRAGRLLSSSFGRLNKRGISLDEALEAINNSQNKARTATELFGVESFTLGLILADNTQQVKDYTAAFNDAGGTLQKLTDEQLKSLDSQLKILGSTWDEFILSIDKGDGFIGGIIRSFVKAGIAVIDFANAVGDFLATDNPFEEGEENAREFADTIGRFLPAAIKEYQRRLIEAKATVEEFEEANSKNGIVAIRNAGEYRDLRDNVLRLEGTLSVLDNKLEETTGKQKKLGDETENVSTELDIVIRKLARFSDELDRAFVQDLSELVFGDQETVEEGLNRNVELVEKALEKIVEANKKAEEEILIAKRDAAEQAALIRDTGFEAASIIGNQLFENGRINRENELIDLQAQKEFELSLVGDDAEKKAQIQALFAQKEKAIKIKQAQAAKKQALFNIALNTAEGITRAIANVGLPLAIPLVIATGVIGAVQAIAVLSRPLPAFEKGGLVETDNAIQTSEKGSEMYVGPDGKIGMTGNKGPEVRTGMKGSFIIPHDVTESLINNGFDHKHINDDSSYRMQKSLQVEKDRHTNRLIFETRKENDLLMEAFNKSMSKIEIHKHHVRRGQLVTDMKKGNTTILDWEEKNSWGS